MFYKIHIFELYILWLMKDNKWPAVCLQTDRADSVADELLPLLDASQRTDVSVMLIYHPQTVVRRMRHKQKQTATFKCILNKFSILYFVYEQF